MKYRRGGPHCMILLKNRAVQKNLQREEKQQRKRKTQGRDSRKLKARPGASGRVLPPVTGRSRVRVAVSSHCKGEGKTCH